jgi:hypothetical protein
MKEGRDGRDGNSEVIIISIHVLRLFFEGD